MLQHHNLFNAGDDRQTTGVFPLTVSVPASIQSPGAGFRLTWSGTGELFLVVSAQTPMAAATAAAGFYGQIAATLKTHSLAIVHERIFCSLSVEAAVLAERKRAFLPHGLPVVTPITCIEGQPVWGEGLAGIIIQAVPVERTRTLVDNDLPCGRAWQSHGAEYLLLQNITGTGTVAGAPVERSLQVCQMLDRADRILRQQGGSYRDVVRTWFYLSDILDWYGDFNRARSEKYEQFGIMPGGVHDRLHLPASTGICGDTGSGAAATMDLLAIIGEPASRPTVTQLTNRGQLDAFRYGAAFSRGALIRGKAGSILQLSGTAAIDEGGKSLFPGDIHSQINCTLDKIAALMSQVGSVLGDIAAATVFVKRPEYAAVFHEIAAERGLEGLPAVCVVADICREELLFEMDAEAVIAE